LSVVFVIALPTFSPELALYCSGSLGLVAIAGLFRPFRLLRSRLLSFVIAGVSALGIIASLAERQIQQETAAKQQREVRLEQLRNSDPAAYLNELKAAGDTRWESELRNLDPKGYEFLLAERHRQKEEARKAEIASLLDELKTLPSAEPSRVLALFSRLAALDPGNPAYKAKRDALATQAAEAGRKAEIAKLLDELKTVPATEMDRIHTLYLNLTTLDPKNEDYKKKKEAIAKQLGEAVRKQDQASNPERFVTIESFSWSKEGFGSIMEASFTIKNSLPWAVKDVEIRCEHEAASGTTIDANARTVYDRIEANSTKRINKFNMGIIHSQATRSGCRVTKVVRW
jgi:hypothetical protein